MTTYQQFANNMSKFNNELGQRTPHNIVEGIAKSYRTSIRQSIESVAPKMKLSGVGGKAKRASGGTTIGVRYTTKDQATSSTSIVQATGPLHLIERDTSEHQIPRSTGSRRLRTAAGRLSYKRESTGRAVRNGGVIFLGNKAKGFAAMGPVTRPETHGKHPFERGALAAERAQQAQAIQQLSASMAKFFRAG